MTKIIWNFKFMKLSVIIVAWQVKDRLRANLEALFKSEVDFDWEVLVVDNNSADGTAEMVARDWPQVKLIINQENFGFARATNQAWREAQGDFVLLLNPDMKVFADSLANLVNWLNNNPQAWAAGGRLVDETGKPITNVRRFPRLVDQLAVVLKLPHLFPKILNKYLCADFDYDRPAKVDSVRGSFLAVRRSAWARIGLLDERFFVWFEEVDYCRRVYQAGGEVWYTPVATAVDYVGQSFKLWPKARAQRIFRQSQLKYFAMWQPTWQVALLWLAWLPSRLLMPLAKIFKISGRART
jgi:GT2 family glycosyltransferase